MVGETCFGDMVADRTTDSADTGHTVDCYSFTFTSKAISSRMHSVNIINVIDKVVQNGEEEDASINDVMPTIEEQAKAFL